MNFEYKYSSDIFRNFREINGNDIYAKIRFFEKHQRNLESLQIHERFEILSTYTDALFTAENYSIHKEYAAKVLEISILENIQYIENVDVYLKTLEQFCISSFKTGDIDQALKLGKQLYPISIDKKRTESVLKKILLKKRPKWVFKVYAISFLIFTIWTVFTILHLLILEPFYPTMALLFNGINQFIILCGIGLIILASLGNFVYVGRALKKIKV